jgi:intracellular sulfur oxidation DsrE/DsrF family protein
MRRIAIVAVLALASVAFVSQRQAPYRVVFDLTSRDTLDQKAALRWIKETSSTHPDVQAEVVMYAKGIELAISDRSAFVNEVKEAMKNPNVKFSVCAIALKNNDVDKSQLIGGVETVPDGIYEVVSKQQEGWGYIKVSH